MDDYPIVLTGCDPRYNRKYEIPILYKDENLFIVHKPHNLRVDGPTEISPTLESHLIQAFGTNEKRDKRALYLLHQLDYVTSGVHCWGFNKRSASVVGKLFIRKQIQKTYVALVKGHLDQNEFVIKEPIASDPSISQKMAVLPTGKPAQTRVEVLERGFFRSNGIPITHVSLSPLSGRKHQLRLHMAHIGHPIVGDYMYDPAFKTTDTEYRTMLHALKIRIPYPGLDKPIEVCTDDPFVPLFSSASSS